MAYIQIQTKLDDPITVYDTENTGATETPWMSFVKNMLQPVVQVKQGDLVLYKTGDFYEPWPLAQYAFITMAALGVIFVVAGTKSK